MKKTTRIIVSLLVLVMTLCLFAGCEEKPAETTAPAAPTEPTKPVDLNLDVYYNKTHTKVLAADATDKTFHMTLYNKSKSVTVRVKDEATAQKILDATTMLLVKDNDGVVTDIKAIEDVSGKFVAAGSYVKAVDGNKVTVTSGTFGAGWDLGTFEMAANCNVTDTTGGSTVGAIVKLRANDQIYAVANAKGEVKQVFIVSRVAEQRVAHCAHCDKDVVWTAHYPDMGTVPTTAGHWYLTGNMTSKAANVGANEIILDLNGYTVSTVPGAKVYTCNNAASKLFIMDSSEAKTGGIVAVVSDLTAAGGLIAVSTKGAQATLISGTLDASKIVSNQTGAAVYAASGCTFTMLDGKIIGGTVNGVMKTDGSGADQGGRGGAVNVGGGATFVMKGGEIVGGKAVKAEEGVTRAQGGAVYVYADAKMEVSGGKIHGGTADLGGNCVFSEKEGNITVTGGEIEDIEYKA